MERRHVDVRRVWKQNPEKSYCDKKEDSIDCEKAEIKLGRTKGDHRALTLPRLITFSVEQCSTLFTSSRSTRCEPETLNNEMVNQWVVSLPNNISAANCFDLQQTVRLYRPQRGKHKSWDY